MDNKLSKAMITDAPGNFEHVNDLAQKDGSTASIATAPALSPSQLNYTEIDLTFEHEKWSPCSER